MNTTAKTIFALLVLANVGLVLWAPVFGRTARRPRAASGAAPGQDASGRVSPVSNCRRAIPGRLLPAKAEAGGCYRIGPFTESAQADKASAVLKEIPLAYERRAEEQTVVTGYRVYLPPLPTREAAERNGAS